uniref:hypothetical protein n=1 Tax=Ningiella ruwaisensis TaxID=2364274 RepID=UPI00109F23D3|nr:hypothetical protein [Ningiella ruwaisensis]
MQIGKAIYQIATLKPTSQLPSFACLLLLGFFISACSDSKQDIASIQAEEADTAKNTNIINSERFFTPPKLRDIPLPEDLNNTAVWNGVGINDEGEVYLGLSSIQAVDNTAFVISIDPKTQQIKRHSDAVSQLKQEGVYETGLSQKRLQTDFIADDDGFIYFATHDRMGMDKSNLSQSGSYLWRMHKGDDNWELLLKTEESIIAIKKHKQFIFALSFWDHVLYKYDTVSQLSSAIKIGSFPRHFSRKFIIDKRGHIFVPRVEKDIEDQLSVVLVELNTDLAILDIHPMPDYWNANGLGNHGIVASTETLEGVTYFTVASGGLYKLEESVSGRSKLDYLGKFEPQLPESYISLVIAPEQVPILVGFGKTKRESDYYWFIRELSTNIVVNYPATEFDGRFLLYGANHKRDKSQIYIVGEQLLEDGISKPVLYKAEH